MRIWCVLIVFLSFRAFAQVNDEELAAEFLNNKEFEKAAVLYEKLLKKDNASPYYYINLLTCYIELKSWSDAEKMIKKQVKNFPDNYFFRVDQGYILQKQNKNDDASEIYNNLIKSLEKYPSGTVQLATAFLRRDLPDYAISTYINTRKYLKNEQLYSENLLDLFVLTGKSKELIDECIKILVFNNQYFEKSKEYLIKIFDKKTDIDYLKQKCIETVSKHPEKKVFDDLFIWTFIQSRDFAGAYRQSVAIDKREKGEGYRLLDLAQICLSNYDYETAVKCLKYIIALGENGSFFVNASYGLLETKYMVITSGNNDSSNYVSKCINEYNDFLKRFGKNSNTSKSIKQLADLYMFYQYDIAKAITLLEEISSIPGVSARFVSESKLQLADAYLISGDIWEAQLLYSQVDKDFKEDPLGQEAKFRNARLSYFNGDFEWAKEQLDILKTATSQLIANDALELSLMIQENTGLDSTTDALEQFAKADLLIFQNNLDKALEILNLFPFTFPHHDLEDDILFAKARIMEKKKDFSMAIKLYESLITLFGDDIFADNAIYNLAKIYDFKLKDKKKAKETYEKLIFNYTSSLFTVEARKRQKILSEELGS
ncbi:MAG: tetratricopeptide repeat protein [Bacteroidetes bacterium]|nr:tetratricopeptide repeat protein [Bacteroidota bacterium]